MGTGYAEAREEEEVSGMFVVVLLPGRRSRSRGKKERLRCAKARNWEWELGKGRVYQVTSPVLA